MGKHSKSYPEGFVKGLQAQIDELVAHNNQLVNEVVAAGKAPAINQLKATNAEIINAVLAALGKNQEMQGELEGYKQLTAGMYARIEDLTLRLDSLRKFHAKTTTFNVTKPVGK